MRTSFTLDKEVGAYCKEFRINELDCSRFQIGVAMEFFEASTRNIQSFERGGSSNLGYIFLYYKKCKTQEQAEKFLLGLDKVFKKFINEGEWINE